jgi:hypothetical protein
MIISTYENEKRTANVCKQGSEWVVMCYESNQYLKDILAVNENQAELIADQWLNHEPV